MTTWHGQNDPGFFCPLHGCTTPSLCQSKHLGYSKSCWTYVNRHIRGLVVSFWGCFSILLMEEILHHLRCRKSWKNRINYQPQLVTAGCLSSTVFLHAIGFEWTKWLWFVCAIVWVLYHTLQRLLFSLASTPFAKVVFRSMCSLSSQIWEGKQKPWDWIEIWRINLCIYNPLIRSYVLRGYP